jgi:hypothetical protein
VFGTTVVLVAIACVVAVGVFATRTTRSSAPDGARAASSTVRGQPAISAEQRASLRNGLTFVPAAGTTAVAPDTPIVVRAASGKISDVRVTTSSGAPVARDFVWTFDGWQSEGVLAYGASYRVTATVAGPSNVKAEASATFQTLAPSAIVSTSVFPNSGLTLGVGQPIDFRFSEDITSPTARAGLLNHLSVT